MHNTIDNQIFAIKLLQYGLSQPFNDLISNAGFDNVKWREMIAGIALGYGLNVRSVRLDNFL